MKLIKKILNDSNKISTIVLNIYLFSSIIMIIKLLFFFEFNIFEIKEKSENFIFIITLIVFLFSILLKLTIKKTFCNNRFKIRSRLNFLLLCFSIYGLIYTPIFIFVQLLEYHIIFFINFILISIILSFVSDKFKSLSRFIFIYNEINIPNSNFEVSQLNISFMNKNISFIFNNFKDSIIINGYEVTYLELKNYLDKKDINLNEFDINHLNLIKIITY